MKCDEIAEALERLEPLYTVSHCGVPRALTNFKMLLQAASGTTASQFAKKLDKLSTCAQSEEAIETEEIVIFAEALFAFLDRAGKPALLKDLKQLVTSIKPHGFINPDQLTQFRAASKPSAEPVRSDLINAHHRSLEQSLGDEVGFTSAFRAVELDPNLRAVELIALAKQFSFAVVKSKSAALKKIWARHQALMTSRAKAAATAGRIAG